MAESIVRLTGLDAWAETVVKRLRENETRAGHRQRLYAATYGRLLLLATKHLTGNVRAFLKY